MPVRAKTDKTAILGYGQYRGQVGQRLIAGPHAMIGDVRDEESHIKHVRLETTRDTKQGNQEHKSDDIPDDNDVATRRISDLPTVSPPEVHSESSGDGIVQATPSTPTPSVGEDKPIIEDNHLTPSVHPERPSGEQDTGPTLLVLEDTPSLPTNFITLETT